MSAELFAFMAGTVVLKALAAPQSVAINHLPTAKYVSGAAPAPTKNNNASLGIDVSAKSAVVMDVDSGAWLYEKDADQPQTLASLSKIVAAMTYLDTKPDLSKPFTLTQADAGISHTIVPLDETLSVQDALQAMLVGSANEVANAIARTQGGKATFVAAMNKKAKALGMEHSVFYDASGEDPRNKGSARDVAIALKAAMNYPLIANADSKTEVTVQGIKKAYKVKSTNLLITSDLNKAPYKIITAKTGTLPEAGYCFAQATRDASGHVVIAVILGGETHYSRFQDVKGLTYWAFKNYAWPTARY